MPNRFVSLGVFTACLSTASLASNVLAQEPTGTVTGTVVDSRNQPVSGVLVFMDVGPGSAATGTVGAFQLEGVAAGTHALSLRKAGFAPRTFSVVLEPNEDRRDIGVIMLEEGPDPTATLRGSITDQTTGRPLADAVVEVNGDVVALTDDNGQFLASDLPITWGSNQLEVSRISFDAVISEFWIAIPGQTFDFSATLDPLPIGIDGVAGDVAAAPFVSTKMEPFYERRDTRPGIFLIGPEIVAMNPSTFTDVFRGMPGVTMGLPGSSIRGGQGEVTGMKIRFRRSRGRCLSPLIFLDGLFLGGGHDDYVNLDDLVSAEEVGGMEVYGAAVRIPMEFSNIDRECGAIVIWTRI